MKTLLFILVVCSLAGPLHAQRNDALQSALTLICDHPEAYGSREYSEATQLFTASFPTERLEKLGLPERALAWLPDFGPCGGPGSPLLVAFYASAARDSNSEQKSRVVYRAWQVVLKHYGYFRKTAPKEFPVIPALEKMKQKEKDGGLLRDAILLFEKKP